MPGTLHPCPCAFVSGIFLFAERVVCISLSAHARVVSSPTLTDSKDQPIRPYNFALGRNDSRFKCGAENQDLYRIFMTGVDGTPMPSFADVIQPNDAWDLVHYLRTLQTGRRSKENDALKAAGGPATLKSPENKSENSSPANSDSQAFSGGR